MCHGLALGWKHKKVFFFLGFLGLLLVGCAFNEGTRRDLQGDSTSTLTGMLNTYMTVTPNLKTDQDAAVHATEPNPTTTPLPTSTPVVYEVIENETLYSVLP